MKEPFAKAKPDSRSVLDNSRDFIYRSNLKTGRFEYVSPSVKELLGYTPEEFAAMNVSATMATIHPDDMPSVTAALARLDQTGTAEVEYRLRNKNGDYVWFSNNMSIMKDIYGKPLYRNGNARNITERKKAEEIRHAILDRFYLVLSNVPLGILLITEDSRVEFANRSFCELFDIKRVTRFSQEFNIRRNHRKDKRCFCKS